MTEQQLQHKLIMWFSQQYPQHRGLLFEINNDTEALKQAMKRRAMGMIAGASDLGFIDPNNGHFIGIELKAPESRHKLQHIKQQIEWGQKIIDAGGMYIMCSDLEDISDLILSIMKGNNRRAREIFDAYWNDVWEKIDEAQMKWKKSVTF